MYPFIVIRSFNRTYIVGMLWDFLAVTQNSRPCLAGMILEKDSIRKKPEITAAA